MEAEMMYGMMQRAAADDLHGLIAAAGAGGDGGGGFRAAAAAAAEAERDGGGEEEMEEMGMGEVKARIASHPRYPTLLRAYIDCQKVGAPPEIASLLEEIRRENDVAAAGRRAVSGRLLVGADPELDDFMELYCEVLVKYRTDLARPFDEATSFLSTMETQLSHLCSSSSSNSNTTSLAHAISGGTWGSNHGIF